MPKLVIDTNIYLNFYRLDSGQSLEMIKNLNQLVGTSGRFKLILPKQIEDEFIRNKNSKSAIYADHILNFERGLEVQFKIPHLIKSTSQIEQIKRLVEKLNQLKKKASEDYKNRVFNPNSKINQQIKTLFIHAHRPTETELVLQKAWFRTLRGNPPRKDNSSFGDAIIWESILDQCSDEDTVLISGDGDFESEIDQGKVHELLSKEWSQKTNKMLKLYTKLGTFINENIKDKKKQIRQETIQEEDRLNSIFTTQVELPSYSTLALQNEPLRLHSDMQTISPTAFTWSALKNKCACCGAEIKELNPYIGFSFNVRCENCQDQFSSAQNCSKCGKHFHRSWTSVNTTYFGKGLCDDCQK